MICKAEDGTYYRLADVAENVDSSTIKINERNLTMDDHVIQTLINIVALARQVNQDGVRFKAEVESRMTETVSVTYRLEIEIEHTTKITEEK